MTIYNLLVLIGYAAAAVLSLGYSRALWWLATGAFCYVAGVLYWNLGGVWPEVVVGVLDAAVCVFIYFRALYKWELVVFILFWLAVTIGLVHSIGMSAAYDHAVALEVINYMLILWVGGVSAFERQGFMDGWAFNPWRSVFGFVRPVYSTKRKAP